MGSEHGAGGNLRALIVGVGGLGCAAAPVLADAGIELVLCDFDRVEARNLGRQDLYDASHIGALKVECAADAVASAGASVAIEARAFDAEMLEGADVVLDCTDDPATRAYIHQACLDAGVPLSWGAVDLDHGQQALVPPGGPCLRCLWPDVGAGRPCGEDTDADVLRRVGRRQAEAALDGLAGAPGGTLWVCDGSGPFEAVRFAQRDGCQCVKQ